jgi:hypothetical protein
MPPHISGFSTTDIRGSSQILEMEGTLGSLSSTFSFTDEETKRESNLLKDTWKAFGQAENRLWSLDSLPSHLFTICNSIQNENIGAGSELSSYIHTCYVLISILQFPP